MGTVTPLRTEPQGFPRAASTEELWTRVAGRPGRPHSRLESLRPNCCALADPFGTLDPFGSGAFSSTEGFADFSQMSKVQFRAVGAGVECAGAECSPVPADAW